MAILKTIVVSWNTQVFPANTRLSILVEMGEKKGSKEKKPREGQRKRGGPGSVRGAGEKGIYKRNVFSLPLILLIIQDYNNRAILPLV